MKFAISSFLMLGSTLGFAKGLAYHDFKDMCEMDGGSSSKDSTGRFNCNYKDDYRISCYPSGHCANNGAGKATHLAAVIGQKEYEFEAKNGERAEFQD